jgi:hypothetical protein
VAAYGGVTAVLVSLLLLWWSIRLRRRSRRAEVTLG